MAVCGTCGSEGDWTLSIHPKVYCSRPCAEAAEVRRRLIRTPRPW